MIRAAEVVEPYELGFRNIPSLLNRKFKGYLVRVHLVRVLPLVHIRPLGVRADSRQKRKQWVAVWGLAYQEY